MNSAEKDLEAWDIIKKKLWKREELEDHVAYLIKDKYCVTIRNVKGKRFILCPCNDAVGTKDNTAVCKHKIAVNYLEMMYRVMKSKEKEEKDGEGRAEEKSS